jgi:serine/threonine protein phosphatase PrpC
VPVSVEWATGSDKGRVRSRNEDSVLASPPIFAVADGMGGYQQGDVASDLAISRLASLSGLSRVDPDMVVQAVLSANLDIRSRSRDSRSPMGTTVVGLALALDDARDRLLVFNVGDSRAYRMSVDQFEQISMDHSVIAELVQSGEVPVAAAATHPHRHVVTRALGFDEALSVDTWLLTPEVGDRYLLCSDGLSNEVSIQEIEQVLRDSESPSKAAAALIELTLLRGARDNVSVVVVFVGELFAEASYGEADTTPRMALKPAAGELIGRVPGSRVQSDVVRPAADLIREVPLQNPSEVRHE